MSPSSSSTQQKPIRILIVGAGAIGCFYGSRLHQPDDGVRVSLICRSNYKAVVDQKGVHMKTRNFGDYLFSPEYVFPNIDTAAQPSSSRLCGTASTSPSFSAVSTSTSPETSNEVQWDYVVITTKALPDVSDDSGRIESIMRAHPKAAIVLIQNGVGIEEPYRKRYGKDVVILTTVTAASCHQEGLGTVVQDKWMRISVGPYTDGSGHAKDGREESKPGMEKAKEFVVLCRKGGIRDAEEHDERDMQAVRWHKLVINAPMNPTSVLTYGGRSSQMASDPLVREHLRACMYEVMKGAEAVLGVKFPPEHLKLATPDKILKSIEGNLSGRPSMYDDWEKGGQMELEVILGNPIRAAKAKGVELPRLQSMYAMLKLAQHRRRDEKDAGQATSKL